MPLTVLKGSVDTPVCCVGSPKTPVKISPAGLKLPSVDGSPLGVGFSIGV